MNDFVFATAPTIRFGSDAFGKWSPEIRAKLGSDILLVTDAGLVETGIVARAEAALTKAGIQITRFDQVVADPPEAIVLQAAECAKGRSGVLGLGGGSALDTAKLAAVLAAPDAQDLSQIYGVGQVSGARLPLALVPTTSGTGSEVTPISIVTTGAKEKMGVVSPQLLPDLAVLDPELTLGLPPHVTAATGIDAMVHAIEAYASANPNNNPISQGLAQQALRLMGPALERAVTNGQDKAARSDMLLGSMLAGQAFANAPVAAVHALAYPLGGHFGLPHGLTNALVLPHVLRFNAEAAADAYCTLAPCLFPELAGISGTEGALQFADALADLSKRCGLPQSLRELDISEDILPTLARDAMNQTRLLVNNPRKVTEQDALMIYRNAW